MPLIIFFRVTLKIVPLPWRLMIGRGWNWVLAHWVLRLNVQRNGQSSQQAAYLAPNHISWLDIPVLFSCVPTSFVARAEVQKLPIAGWLAECVGSLFMLRGAGQAGDVAVQMAQRLRGGTHVAVFSEALSSPGKSVRPFYSRLFAGPIAANAMVQPIAIRFVGDDEGTNASVHYRAPAPFWPTMRSVLVARRTVVRVQFLPPIAADGMTRKALAAAAHASVAAQLKVWGEAPEPSGGTGTG